MLTELFIRDFAIIESLRLQFTPGFTVLTGETGAGKSIILDAMTMLLGGRADTTMIRSGCQRAYLEGTFTLTPTIYQAMKLLLEEEGLDEGRTLLLGRDIRSNGRNVCRVNGQAVTLSILNKLGEYLVDIHGQGEHLSLLKPRAHLPLLDAYAGLDKERDILAKEVRQLRRVQNELDQLRREAQNIEQRVEMLTFQVQEINAANLQPEEEAELRQERARLANAEKLLEHAQEAVGALLGIDVEMDSRSAADLLGEAEREVSQLARLDETRQEWAARLQGLVSEFADLSAEIRDYADELEFNPGRLDFVEERLELMHTLKRKYGADIATVLAYRDRAAAELETISHSEERIQTLAGEVDQKLHQIGRLARALSEKRKEAAGKLAETAVNELKELRMEGARFQVDFRHVPDANGAYVNGQRLAFDHTGIDQAEFLISANPGEPLKPMAKVASGGETARLMLALKTALARVDATPTLIFDEIDQGIGGRVGDIVGRKLWGLTVGHGHQVVVVTHLPQLAGYGDRHFRVTKRVVSGRTLTQVDDLDPTGRVQEMSAMLGMQEHAREGAAALLRRAEQLKRSQFSGELPFPEI
jgi:DNA repair protein RecN (Recombination protein N)